MTKQDRSSWGKEQPEDLVAFDFETFYDRKAEISIEKMNAWNYVFHPKTFPYMMSVKTEGFEWCGDPKEFDRWDVFHGKTICAHNASFDGLIWMRLQKEGFIPEGIVPKRLVCTADLVAYKRVVRNLQNAAKVLLGKEISKEARSSAEGKTAEDMKADGTWDAMVAYGMGDSIECWELACKYLKDWPATAQLISQLNREAAWRGLNIDVDAVRSDNGALEHLKNRVFECGRDIPWYPEEPALSPGALREHARSLGIKVPASLAKTNKEAQEFYNKYEPIYPWAGAVKNFRQATMMLRKVENLDAGIREDGTFPYTSVYFGANTGRFKATLRRNERDDDDSGGKFNPYNLPREPLQGVDLRGLIIPPPGHIFCIADYCQVEALLLLW